MGKAIGPEGTIMSETTEKLEVRESIKLIARKHLLGAIWLPGNDGHLAYFTTVLCSYGTCKRDGLMSLDADGMLPHCALHLHKRFVEGYTLQDTDSSHCQKLLEEKEQSLERMYRHIWD